jgi:hypothetical protein
MVRILEEAQAKTAVDNTKAVKDMTISVVVTDNESGKEKKYEIQKVTNVRFKERKRKLFVRFKCESGIIVSIPKAVMPNFIKIEVEETKVW